MSEKNDPTKNQQSNPNSKLDLELDRINPMRCHPEDYPIACSMGVYNPTMVTEPKPEEYLGKNVGQDVQRLYEIGYSRD